VRTAYRGPLDLLPATPARRQAPGLLRGRSADAGAAAVKLWPRKLAAEDEVALRRGKPQPGRWRRKNRVLRWLKHLAWFLAIVGVPVAGAFWLYNSPRFALQEIDVAFGGGTAPSDASAGRVSEVWVRETVAPFEGHNLLRLPLAEVAARLEQHPWVKSVGLSKELPSRFGVRIVERRAAALLRDGDTLSYLDWDGKVIAPVEGPAPRLVVVELAGPWRYPGSALALLRELEDAGPEWLGGLQDILVLEENDFALSTADLPYPLVVRAGTAADKIRRLRGLLPDIMAHTGAGAAIDLRFEQRIIIQPSAGSGVAGVLGKWIAGTVSGRNS
jgi:cell division septal protein FtsQ